MGAPERPEADQGEMYTIRCRSRVMLFSSSTIGQERHWQAKGAKAVTLSSNLAADEAHIDQICSVDGRLLICFRTPLTNCGYPRRHGLQVDCTFIHSAKMHTHSDCQGWFRRHRHRPQSAASDIKLRQLTRGGGLMTWRSMKCMAREYNCTRGMMLIDTEVNSARATCSFATLELWKFPRVGRCKNPKIVRDRSESVGHP